MIIFFILCELCLVTAFTSARVRGRQYPALILKALASTVFVLTAIYAACTVRSSFALFAASGLLFGLLGDIWLDLRWIDVPHRNFYTFAGFGSFSAQHIILDAGLLTCCAAGAAPYSLILPFVLAAAVGLLIGNAGPLLKLDYGPFRVILIFYAFCLCSAVLLSGSLALVNHLQNGALNVFFLGSVFFLISDLILSGTYFGKGKNRPVDVIANHTTYYMGQILIALSLFLL